MLLIKVNENEYDKIQTLLPDIFPNVKFTLKSQDDTLATLGLCESAPCVVEFDLTTEAFYEMLDELNDIEIDAYNTPSNNLAREKYEKYGCLYDILFNAQKSIAYK